MVRTRWADMAARAANASSSHHQFGAAMREWDRGEYGNALVSRNELSAAQVARLPKVVRNSEPRCAVTADTVAAGTKWCVSTTHLSFYDNESDVQLAFLLDHLAEQGRPTVLMGDFNRRPEQVLPIATAGGWAVADTESTFPSWDPRARIDYVLVKGAEICSATSISTPISDHCAVVAELRPL